MFGSEAAKLLNYTECFPDGYRTGVKIDKACANVGIEGFPTWVINGQVRKLLTSEVYTVHQLEYAIYIMRKGKVRLPSHHFI